MHKEKTEYLPAMCVVKVIAYIVINEGVKINYFLSGLQFLLMELTEYNPN